MDKRRFLVLDPQWENSDHFSTLRAFFGEEITLFACDYFTRDGIEGGNEVAVMVQPHTIVEYNISLVIAELNLFPVPPQEKLNLHYGLYSLENLRAYPQLVNLPIVVVCERLPKWPTKQPLFAVFISWIKRFGVRSYEKRFLALNTLAAFSWEDLRSNAREQERFRTIFQSVPCRQISS